MKEIEAIHFNFNAWGEKYTPCVSVKEMPRLLLEKLKIKRLGKLVMFQYLQLIAGD